MIVCVVLIVDVVGVRVYHVKKLITCSTLCTRGLLAQVNRFTFAMLHILKRHHKQLIEVRV